MTSLLLGLVLTGSGYGANYIKPVPAVAIVRPVEVRPSLITWYSCSIVEGTAGCVTASGQPAGEGTAAHATLPFGTRVEIGGRVYTVIDRGGGLGPDHFDVWAPSRAEAMRRGVSTEPVTVQDRERN